MDNMTDNRPLMTGTFRDDASVNRAYSSLRDQAATPTTTSTS